MSPTPQGDQGWLQDFGGYSLEALEREIARLQRVADRTAPTLVAEDMQTMRLLLVQALRQAGFREIHRAPNGEQGLKLLKDYDCDLALVDWNMPRMDGLEMLEAVRLDPQVDDIIFIMVTAETLDLKVIRAAEEKQDAYLTKPISAEKLTRRLELILERRLTTARALRWEATGNPQRAVDAFLGAAQNRPRARWPLFGLGGLLARQGRYEEAERCYWRVLELDPEATAALVEMGRMKEAQGQVREARQLYQRALEISPQFFRAYDALAESLLAQGRAEQALEVLQKAMDRRGTENARRQELLGRLRFQMEHYPQAERAFAKALELKPRQNRLGNHLYLGRSILAQGRYQEAAEVFRKAARIGREEGKTAQRLECLLLTAKAHALDREVERAETVLAQIADPSSWDGGIPPLSPSHLHRSAGALYLEAGLKDPAFRHLTTSLRLDLNDQDNLQEIRHICREHGVPQMAEEALRAAEASREAQVEAHSRRGLLLVSEGRYQEALEEYRRGLELSPHSARLHFNLARLFERMERREQALASMGTAVRLGLERRDWELVAEVIRFFQAYGRTGEARKLLRQALQAGPDHPQLRAAARELNQTELHPSPQKEEKREPAR